MLHKVFPDKEKAKSILNMAIDREKFISSVKLDYPSIIGIRSNLKETISLRNHLFGNSKNNKLINIPESNILFGLIKKH